MELLGGTRSVGFVSLGCVGLGVTREGKCLTFEDGFFIFDVGWVWEDLVADHKELPKFPDFSGMGR